MQKIEGVQELLTTEEKEFLRSIKKFSKYFIDRIRRTGDMLYIRDEFQTIYSINTDYFKNLENNKLYFLKNLGLDKK